MTTAVQTSRDSGMNACVYVCNICINGCWLPFTTPQSVTDAPNLAAVTALTMLFLLLLLFGGKCKNELEEIKLPLNE